MKYDNRQTLSENVEKITINEQYAAPKLAEIISGPNVTEDLVKVYACQLSKMTFTELANLFKTITPKYGVITPDLTGYGMFNKPSIATAILENEIYLRRLKNKDSFYEIMIPLKKILNINTLGQRALDTSNNIGNKPKLPESTLLSNKIIPGKGFQLTPSYYAGKSATDICLQGVIPASQPKPKPKNVSGMDFTNIPNRKTMWEKINQNYKKKYPNILIDDKDLRINGDNKDKGFSYSELDAKKLYQTNPNWQYPADIGTNIYDFARSAGYGELQSSQILKKFGTPNEKGEYNWKKFVDGQKRQEESKKGNEEYEKILSDSKTDILSNQTVKKVFPNVDELMKEEDCKTQYLKFFKGIIDGSVRNKNGKIVGKAYYNKKGNLYIAKWDEQKPPCTDEWWDKYGMYVQLGAAIAAGIVFPAAGWGLVAQTVIDMGLNVVALKKAIQKQDPAQVNIEIVFTFLPLLMATAPVRAAIERLKYSKETIDSLTNKLKGFDSLSKSARETLLNTKLTSEEKRALLGITTNPELRQILKSQTDEIVDKVSKSAKSAKVSKARWFADPLANILVYGGSFISTYIANKVNEIDKIVQNRLGRPINEDEKKFFEILVTYLKESDNKKIIDTLKIVSDEDFTKAIEQGGKVAKHMNDKFKGTKQGMENLDIERKKLLEKYMNENLEPHVGSEIEILDEPNERVKKEIDDSKEIFAPE